MNIKKSFFVAFALAAAFAVTLTACGSDSSSGSPGVKTTSRGVITGFGSVIVNGVHYDVSGASVTIDDSASNASSLNVGMTVTVKSEGTSASSIDVFNEVKGPITSINTAAHTFIVFGQTVQVDITTLFENTTDLTTLAISDIVEVNGFADNLGVIHASRVEKIATPGAATPIEVKGIVAGLDPGAMTFIIGTLTVSYSAATIMKDFPAGGIANGQRVEVKSTFGQIGPPIAATVVELQSGLGAAEGEHVEVEGYVNSYVSLSDFKVNDVSVDASGVSGVTGIADGVKVEVEGTINAAGVLVASELKIERESEIVLEGDVAAVNAAAGTVTVLGKTVIVPSTAILKDESSANILAFSLANVIVGDHLEIVAFMDTGDVITATKLKRLNSSTEAILQGVVTAKDDIAPTSVTILGYVLDTSLASFKKADGTGTDAATFFGLIAPNTTVVKIKWNNVTNWSTFPDSTPANEAEIEQ